MEIFSFYQCSKNSTICNISQTLLVHDPTIKFARSLTIGDIIYLNVETVHLQGKYIILKYFLSDFGFFPIINIYSSLPVLR